MKDTADDDSDDENRPIDKVTTSDEVPRRPEWEMVVQRSVDDQSGGLTTTIVYAVAEAEGVRPVDVKDPPLFDVVDTTALEEAFFRSDDPSYSGDGQSTTEFTYRGHRVGVRDDGWVFVYDRVDD